MVKKRKYILVILLIVALNSGTLYAQNTISLKECINRTIEHNPNIRMALEDEKIASIDRKIVLSSGLPQINANSAIVDNIKLQKVLLPGELMGQPGQDIAISMGSKFNVDTKIEASQLLYSHTYFIGLKAAKTSQELYELVTKSTKEELIFQVSNLYYNILIVNENKKIVENNLKRLNKIHEINKARYESELVNKLDLNRVEVSINELKANNLILESNIQTLYNNLKLLMGTSLEEEFTVEDNDLGLKLSDSKNALPQLDLGLNTNYLLSNKKLELRGLQIKAEKSERVPTLAAFGSIGSTAMTSEFSDISNSDKWFGSSMVGLKLQIPIFNGFRINNKVRKAKKEYAKAQIEQENLTKKMKSDYRNAVSSLSASWQAFISKKENVNLAKDLFDQSLMIYSEGLLSLTDLLEIEQQLVEAEVKLSEQQYKYNMFELELLRTTSQLNRLAE
ncbi:MAG: TolC family protein [Hyphomicrobiales bacterium]